MSGLLETLEKEWDIIRNAPWNFIAAVVVVGVAIYGAMEWRYKAQIETSNSRLQAKDDQIAEYRQRLGIVEKTRTAYSILSHAELKKDALDLVRDMRIFINEKQKRSDALSYARMKEMSAVPQEEMLRVHWEQIQKMSSLYVDITSEYNTKFKAKTILIRDELLTRLPPTSSRDISKKSKYEHPMNFFLMEEICSDLESLAKNLPDK